MNNHNIWQDNMIYSSFSKNIPWQQLLLPLFPLVTENILQNENNSGFIHMNCPPEQGHGNILLLK
jgi:hypothetical protein